MTVLTAAQAAGSTEERELSSERGIRRRAPRRSFTGGRVTRSRALSYIPVVLYALTLVLPLYWLTISAFKDRLSVIAEPFLPTFSAGVSNLVTAWNAIDLGQAMINSAYTTVGALILTLVLAVPASYALARSKGRVATWLERLFALGFLIPGFAALVPTLLLAIAFGLFYEREFLIAYLPASAQPLAVILLTQFMRTVPPELEESARIDGAGRFRILFSVYLPLVAPGVATVTILNFISFWNEYLFSLVIVGVSEGKRTLQVALPTLQGNLGVTDYALVCAGTLIAVAPVFIVYAILNRRMEDALMQGALKG
ncbi:MULTISPECIES: carbohydrate ABC transporter permease [unclassified Microbacterium]|uniref:carbohydrate ABC transporter permease n=1 Tax=Microbacterium TaxID=33882 RepID=UPI003B9F4778